ncbi:MAG TPA: rod shape-determining protein RodA [bacterium]|nr:rod shape-determining protein RodA [bacterium]
MGLFRYFKERDDSTFIVILTYILVIIGLLLLYSASKGIIFKSSFFVKQCIWVILGTIIIIFLNGVNYRELKRFAPILYFIILFLLLIVLATGEKGPSRWINLGWLYFQPSEFAKFVLIVALSAYLENRNIRKFSVFFTSLLIVFIPFILVLLQPNLGTAFIFIFISLGILYQADMSRKQFLSLFFIVLLLSPILWFSMKGYQKERILTFINPGRDPIGAGYNLLQSKITIGSGGLIGKGFLKGTQTKLAFLPEYHTDFIFCVLAEEFGFIGVLIFLFLYYLFFKKIIEIISFTTDEFGKLLATGILTLFVAQFTINIGMTMGLFPIVGIPLPFISYGGSSLITCLICIIFLKNIQDSWSVF